MSENADVQDSDTPLAEKFAAVALVLLILIVAAALLEARNESFMKSTNQSGMLSGIEKENSPQRLEPSEGSATVSFRVVHPQNQSIK